MPQERMSLEEYRKLNGLGPVSPATGMTKVRTDDHGFIPNAIIDPRGKQKPSKYGAKRTKVDGITFDSKAESDYYAFLKSLYSAGAVAGFCRQPEFVLQDGDGTVIRYKPDFVVWYPEGRTEVVECKGFETADWKLRDKLFRAKYPKIPLIVVK